MRGILQQKGRRRRSRPWQTAVLACLCTHAAWGAALYQEDFSDVSDWVVVYNDQGGAVSLASDGALGTFSIEAPNNFAAFAPLPNPSVFAPFDASRASGYFLRYAVAGLTDSTSYSIEIDQFDSGQNYLSTVFSVAPQGTFVGTNTVFFTGYPWDPAAAYILPKVTMYTGLGNQTVTFDFLEIGVIPEPGSLMLLMVGGALVYRCRTSRCGRALGTISREDL